MFNFFRNGRENGTAAAYHVNGNSNGLQGHHVNGYAREGAGTKAMNEGSNAPDVGEKLFVEYERPRDSENPEPDKRTQEVANLQTLYRYLGRNLEKQGYEDALTNPDTSYMDDQIRFIQNDLSLLMWRINSYYNGYLKQIDFHIQTRKRSGMVETVDELLSHKATVEDEMRMVAAIEQSAKAGTGITENLLLSYKKGFKNGLAAITYNSVLSGRSQ